MPLRISAKNLGHLALPDACPRCFWIQTRQKVPFQIFPGIFSSIDSYSKKITNLHHARHGHIPQWFSQLGDLGHPIPCPHHSKFQMVDSASGITLTGAADEMTFNGHGYWILDYKTARWSTHQQELSKMYETQLTGYALIAEALGLKPVVGLGLIYYEPRTAIGVADLDDLILEDGFAMHFNAHLLPITLDRSTIPPLLRKAKAIHESPEPPQGLDGCKDCKLVEGVLALLTKADAIPM
ncbi:MAG: PD-(D/E)XK nuclease family protein [Lentisphaerae bacterium]|nr:PD-(D/E)XK nuclease family protein [Lentisphaerota bacterium]